MAAVILFVVVLVLTFGVLVYFLRPTATEAAVQQQLAGIDASRAGSTAGTTIVREQPFSSNPQVNDLLKNLPGSHALLRLIKQAGQKWQVGPVFLFSVLTITLGWWFASLVISSFLLSALTALAVALAPYLYLYVARLIRYQRFGNLLPEAVDLMSRGLRAGHATTAVLEMVGQEIAEPVASEFRALHEEQVLGLTMRDAMLNLVERVPLDDVRFLATAILLQRETGGNLAQILDKTAAVMRERARLRGQLRIYTAQGRITGWILCIMPFVMFGLMTAVNKKYESILLTDPKGLHMLYFGIVMMVLGILAIRKIINVKV
jgi:tight adherence protein B